MVKQIQVRSEADIGLVAASLTDLPASLYLTRHWCKRRTVVHLSIPMAAPAKARDVIPSRYHPMLRIIFGHECPDVLMQTCVSILFRQARVIATDPRSLYRRMQDRGRMQGPLADYVLSEIADGALPNRMNFLRRTRNRPGLGSTAKRPTILDSSITGFA